MSQEPTITINQEFSGPVSQLLQLSFASQVGNAESTEIIEATRNDNRCIQGSEVLHTMPSQSQFYAGSWRKFVVQIWELIHTVFAKNLRMLLDVGIRRIEPQQGLLLNPSLSSRSKG